MKNSTLVLLSCCFFFACSVPKCFSQENEDEAIIEKQAIAWLSSRCKNQTEALLVAEAEKKFFSQLPCSRLHGLQFHKDKSISVPTAWRIAQRNIFILNKPLKNEMSFFGGFLLGQFRATGSAKLYREFFESIEIDRDDSISLKFKTSAEFDPKMPSETRVGRKVFLVKYPQLQGMPNSKPGLFIEKALGDDFETTETVNQFEIPMLVPLDSPWNGAFETRPQMATFFVSEDAFFCVTAFNEVGLFIQEINIRSGKPTRVYYFDLDRLQN